MKSRKKTSIYQVFSLSAQQKRRKDLKQRKIDVSKIVKRIRDEKGLSGAELCRQAGDLDPRTLTAIEKGRIRNPSIKTLISVSRGLGVTLGQLFTDAELETEQNFYLGTQKGAFEMDFPRWGVKMVSYTPFIKDFFCGKMVVAPKRKVSHTFLAHPVPLFIATVIGRFDIQVESKKVSLKEGENLFFNGMLKHSFTNALHRESVLSLTTAPSFL